MAETLLGIDLGTNSAGWVLYELGENGEPCAVKAMGVRIFADGRDPQSGTSLNESRRDARLMRRHRDRYLQRRQFLMDTLVTYGFMPKVSGERKALEKYDPYQLRALAANSPGALADFAEKHGVDPRHLFGRALFHLNQRRGFKSNRKTDRKSNDDGPVKESIEAFRSKLNGQTVGQFLWKRHRRHESIRARRGGTNKTDLYSFYSDRRMIEGEFGTIWRQQAERDANFFTDQKQEKLRKVIFMQRDLKPPIVGKCRYFPGEERAPLAALSYQRFRILQEVNNLRYYDLDGEKRLLPVAARKKIIEKLTTQKSLTFNAMLKIIKVEGKDENAYSLKKWGEKREGLSGDETTCILAKNLGKRWWEMSEKEREDFVLLLVGDKSEDDLRTEFIDKWRLSEEEAEECIGAYLPEGRGQLCLKAVALLLPHMEEGKIYNEAVEAAGLGSHSESAGGVTGALRLPPYPEILAGHCLPRKIEDEGAPEKWRIPNPTVHVALNQLRALVNDIIRIHGKPAKFVLELARDLPKGKKAKQETEKWQKKNQDKRDERRKLLENEAPSIDATKNANIRRLALWEETSENPNERGCVYCGKKIGISSLFSPEVHIDHILPYSKTLDDSMANKTIACQACNADKGNKSPFDAFGFDESRYNDIRSRALKMPHNKAWRFQSEAMDLGHEGFLARHLTDTQYIAKVARLYLESIATRREDILVIPGRLTALLRHVWELGTILDEIRGEVGRSGGKNRNDHRHHAIDAAVVGAISRSLLQRCATQAAKNEDRELSNLYDGLPQPMPNFRALIKDAVKKIIVSHKSNRKRGGRLHNETAYGIVGEVRAKGEREVVHRVMLRDLKKGDISKIRDPKIREGIEIACDNRGFKEGINQYAEETGVRRIRLVETLSVIPLPKDNPYKAYKGDGNWAYEIFQMPNGKWNGEIISTFDANKYRRSINGQGDEQRIYTHVPRWRESYHDAKFVMRIHRNDMIALGDGDNRRVYRVQRISDGKIVLAEHFEANADKRNRDKSSNFKFIGKSPNSLKKDGGRKLHVSPAGMIQISGATYKKRK